MRITFSRCGGTVSNNSALLHTAEEQCTVRMMNHKQFTAILLIMCLSTTPVDCEWGLFDYVAAAVGAGVAVVAAPVVVTAAGFTAGGIAAGSAATGMMSASATYGTGAAVVATCQSIGAAGLGAAATAVTGAAGAAAGKVVKDVIED